MSDCSDSIGRQVGILADRKGNISHVIVGDARGIFIPELTNYPLGRKVLRGLRLIHTHLKSEQINQDDITDLSLLRLDALIVIGMKDGHPENVSLAHLSPSDSDGFHEINGPVSIHGMDRAFERFDIFITSVEEGLLSRRTGYDIKDKRERAVLVSVSTAPRYEQEDSIEELKELAKSSNVLVLDAVLQRPKNINPRYLMGEGKLKELVINAMNKGATLLIFDQDLNPSQSRSISDITELKVIDRSQLILDIFARRAHSKDGKVQVELAQLRYRLPRLTGRGTAMSKLMGGIGGRGPGEMKLEVDRRRVRERILTKSGTFVEDKMFATLDTASRRLRFPKERDVIITDTVGFIRDLPKDLFAAFKATLEELEDADLLLHLVDISNPRFEQQMKSVDNILSELDLADKPSILVFNKDDLIDKAERDAVCRRYDAISISAVNPESFETLLKALEESLWPM
jgi:GTP-binding protein HflX